MKRIGPVVSEDPKVRFRKVRARLRTLARQGEEVRWAEKTWRLGEKGLLGTGWGDVGWDELGVAVMEEIERRVRKERARRWEGEGGSSK